MEGKSIREQITEMRRFLMLCDITGYLMADQILLINLALTALEDDLDHIEGKHQR